MGKDIEILDLNEETETKEKAVEAESVKAVGKKSKKKSSKKTSWKKELLSWTLYFLAAIVLAVFLKNFVIINATVPTGSMMNTIQPKDDLIGFRLSYLFSEPERGDIIIFKFPDDNTQKYIKRVIGLPGETVTIVGGNVFIDDSIIPLEEPYLMEEWIKANGPYTFEVPEGCYFVMGDNRNNSEDSRYWQHTYVTKEEIIGKALFVYYPFDHMGMLK